MTSPLVNYYLIHAIPKNWKLLIRECNNLPESESEILLTKLLECKQPSRMAYDILINNPDNINVLISKWHRIHIDLTTEKVKWGLNYKRMLIVTKYGSFQSSFFIILI